MKRTLLRSILLVLSIFVGALFCITPVWADAPIIVTTTADLIADDNACSLREAIIAANTDSIFHDCAGGSGADTISFDPALPKPAIFVLTQVGAAEESAQTGDLDISGTLHISGASPIAGVVSPIIIDGNGTDRIFEILSGAVVSMVGVTIQNGNPGAAANGGGVLVDLTARLTLTHSQVISNSAVSGGGLVVLGRATLSGGKVAANHGGGIVNDGGLVTLHKVTVNNNHAGYGLRNQNLGVLIADDSVVSENEGGGLHNAGATARLNKLTIAHNHDGGGIYNQGTTLTRLTLNQSLVISNTASSGGGIYNEGIGARADIQVTRISDNLATGAGGGLLNNGIMTLIAVTIDHNGARSGGGLHHIGGALTVVNATISQNRAGDNGGGLYNGANATLTNSTLTQNQANGEGGNIFNDEASLASGNTIVANALMGANCVNSSGFLVSTGHNLESAADCNFSAIGDITNTNPLLGPLQDNGGPTVTHALLPTSPAIDGGAALDCPPADQRGIVRPQGIACDIGAYEVGAIADLSLTVSSAPTPIQVGQSISYTLVITNQGPDTAAMVLLTDTIPLGATFYHATIDGVPCIHSGAITCTVASLGAGLSLTATIVITAPLSAGLITNTAAVTAITPDLNSGNNRVVTSLPVTVPASNQTQISIEPPSPTTNDPISITISGIYTSSCTPHYATHTHSGNLIAISSTLSTEPFCLPAEFPWHYTIGLPALPAGQYTATHTLGAVIDTLRFTVTGALSNTHPVFSVAGNQIYTVRVGEIFQLNLSAKGLPSPTYSLVHAPPGMTIDPLTGDLVWLPSATESGALTVTVRATNSVGSADYTFAIALVRPGTIGQQYFLPLVVSQ